MYLDQYNLCKLELTPTGLVDPHPKTPRPPPPQLEFVCIWDRNPMFEVHVLAMPRHRVISPEGVTNANDIITALMNYVKTKIIAGFKQVPRYANWEFEYPFVKKLEK